MGSHSRGDGSAPNVVAIPFVWPGHNTPMLHLCRHLVSLGCNVTLFRFPEQSDSSGSTVEYDMGVKIVSSLPLPPGGLLPGDRDDNLLARMEAVRRHLDKFQSLGDEVMPLMEELCRNEGPITCIISDVYVGWACGLAAKLKVEWIALWTSTVAELVIYHNMPNLIANEVFPFAGPPSEDLITCIPGLPPLRPQDYPSFELIPEKELHKILHCFKDMVQKIPLANRVLVNSMYEVETGAIDALRDCKINVQPVGPLHLLTQRLKTQEELEEAANREPIIQWLDKKSSGSVLYVAFGTTMPMAAGQFQELAFALEESGQLFVWAIRQDVARLLPPGFPERMEGRDQGLVVNWAPQVAILNHPSVGAFFTHCGWNSVLEGMSNGTVMIARPISGDQILTRRFLVEEWGIAVGVEGGIAPTDVANREAIKKAIAAAMDDDVRRRTAEMKKVVLRAVDEKGSSWSAVRSLVYDLYKWCDKN